MDYLQGLNENQKEAVLSDSQYIRIIAGAGSGKTRVLTTRIAHLIMEKSVFPNKILAITFTNKAANEMKERIVKILDDNNTAVWISTIHSLCVRILREDIQSLNFPRNFTILDNEDQKAVLKEAYKDLGIDRQKIPFNSALAYISGNKGAEINVEKAKQFAGSLEGEENKAKIYEYYTNRLNKLYALDFDDLLLVTRKLFRTWPEIRGKWSKRFKYIHVDEFQDIDSVQYDLIAMLASNDNYLYVVGDPDQTIYSWRGADVNIIMSFEKDFENAQSIVLNQNYRSTNAILNGANSLIKNNKFRIEKDLFTEAEGGSKIIHQSLANEDYEAYWIAEKIRELRVKKANYRDIGILYRSNYLSRALEKSLVENRIPYVIFGGIRFYERAEVKDALSFLRMILINDDLAFKRVINNPKRGIGNKTLDSIFEIAQREDITMYDVTKQYQLFGGKVQRTLDNFVQLIEGWKQKASDMVVEEILDMCLEESGYREMLESQKETDRLENLKELMNDIESFQENYPESTLEEYLQLVSLYGDKSQYESGEYVQLMTIHAAKGLEFDNVFVIGLSDGVFPSERSMAEGIKGVEEERRLAYVAMTRAKKQLYLSDASGFSYVLNKPRVTSRFVNEIADEYIETIRSRAKVSTNESIFNKTALKPTQNIQIHSQMNKTKVSGRYRKGDRIMHNMFNEGIVISIEGNVLQIAFNYPYGLKKISGQYDGMKKI